MTDGWSHTIYMTDGWSHAIYMTDGWSHTIYMTDGWSHTIYMTDAWSHTIANPDKAWAEMEHILTDWVFTMTSIAEQQIKLTIDHCVLL